jgi:hypothetical protein
MQPLNPRPSLQPSQRPTGGVHYGRSSVQVPQRGYGTAVDRAMMHNFNNTHPVPTGYGHFADTHQAQQQRPPTYANSTQALFADNQQPAQTPYQQMYHFDPIKQHRPHGFPFRAFMITLVVGAVSFGAYAVYRAFTNPSPINAESPYSEVIEP